MTYGLPTGSQIFYGAPGFPAWVYELGSQFGLKASTYPGHQEGSRAEAGFAPNPQRLNRGIDWVGTPEAMDRFATYLLTIRSQLEQVIWEHPQTGRRVGVAGGDDVTSTGYYAQDYAGHRDHVHTRQSKPIPLPKYLSTQVPKETTVGWTGDPVWLAEVLRAQEPKLNVVELPDWMSYGHGDYGPIWGVMVHHTGNARADAMSIRNGRPDLRGPLSNLHIAQDGTVTVVAAGVCWHAGMGSYPGIPTDGGNQVLIGIECAWPRDTSHHPGYPNPGALARRRDHRHARHRRGDPEQARLWLRSRDRAQGVRRPRARQVGSRQPRYGLVSARGRQGAARRLRHRQADEPAARLERPPTPRGDLE
jgi:hypothetical protein